MGRRRGVAGALFWRWGLNIYKNDVPGIYGGAGGGDAAALCCCYRRRRCRYCCWGVLNGVVGSRAVLLCSCGPSLRPPMSAAPPCAAPPAGVLPEHSTFQLVSEHAQRVRAHVSALHGTPAARGLALPCSRGKAQLLLAPPGPLPTPCCCAHRQRAAPHSSASPLPPLPPPASGQHQPSCGRVPARLLGGLGELWRPAAQVGCAWLHSSLVGLACTPAETASQTPTERAPPRPQVRAPALGVRRAPRAAAVHQEPRRGRPAPAVLRPPRLCLPGRLLPARAGRLREGLHRHLVLSARPLKRRQLPPMHCSQAVALPFPPHSLLARTCHPSLMLAATYLQAGWQSASKIKGSNRMLGGEGGKVGERQALAGELTTMRRVRRALGDQQGKKGAF